MLVKLLMSLNEKYELAGSTISVDVHEVRATFRFPEHNLPKLREIANNWAERGYITAKHLLMLQRAGMADVSNIPPRWAPSRRDKTGDYEGCVRRMSPIPRPNPCQHPRTIILGRFKDHNEVVYRCELCGAILTLRI